MMKIPERKKGYLILRINVPYKAAHNVAVRVYETATITDIALAVAKRFQTTPLALIIYKGPAFTEVIGDECLAPLLRSELHYEEDLPHLEPDLIINHPTDFPSAE